MYSSRRLEQRYWEAHPRDLNARLERRRRFRDVCRKGRSICGHICGTIICCPFMCMCEVCYGPNACGEMSPPETPTTPSPPPTPRLKPAQISALAPEPLREDRRCLSLSEAPQIYGLPENSSDRGEKSSTPPLLRLPREIRFIIWEMVLCDHVVHIGWSPRRLHHTTCARCNASEFGKGPDQTCWPFSLEPSLHHHRRNYAQDVAMPSIRLLGLLMSCRAMSDFLYNGCLLDSRFSVVCC